MKSGCFIKIVVLGTILIAAFVYFIQERPNFFFSVLKEPIKNNFEEHFEERMKNIEPSLEKDSLSILFNDFINNTQSFEDLDDSIMTSFISQIEVFKKDNRIDSIEFHELLTTLKNNERSKKK